MKPLLGIFCFEATVGNFFFHSLSGKVKSIQMLVLLLPVVSWNWPGRDGSVHTATGEPETSGNASLPSSLKTPSVLVTEHVMTSCGSFSGRRSPIDRWLYQAVFNPKTCNISIVIVKQPAFRMAKSLRNALPGKSRQFTSCIIINLDLVDPSYLYQFSMSRHMPDVFVPWREGKAYVTRATTVHAQLGSGNSKTMGDESHNTLIVTDFIKARS